LRISIKDERGGGSSGEIGLPTAHDTPTLLRCFHELWRQRAPGTCPIKKVNVIVSGLVLASQASRPLFAEMEKLQRVSQAMDAINVRWGSSAAYFCPMHAYRQPMENKIAFGRIPDEVE
jgi:DNA polymerase-4